MENGDGEYAQDGSVDLRGNPVLRSKRGGWTACTFIVGTYVRRSTSRPVRALARRGKRLMFICAYV